MDSMKKHNRTHKHNKWTVKDEEQWKKKKGIDETTRQQGKLNKLWIEPLPNQDKLLLHGLDGFRYHYDGAWWRHEAPSAAEMMEEAWKSGRQFVGFCLQWIGERMNDLEVVLV